MKLKEAQLVAKSLGLPYSRRTVEELEAAIAKYRAENPDAHVAPDVAEDVVPTEPETIEPAVQEEGEVKEPGKSAAVILDKHMNEIRRYEYSVHGESFGVLAKEFAAKKGYAVKFV